MRVGLEVYFIMNTLMNFTIMYFTSKLMGRTRLYRMVIAALIGAIYAVIMRINGMRWMTNPAMQVLLAVVMSAVNTGSSRPNVVGFGAVMIFVTTLLLGGLANYFANMVGAWTVNGALLTLVFGTAIGSVLFRLGNKKADRWEVQLDIRTQYGSSEVIALIDTGNRLRENISGLPVLIIAESALRNSLPPNFDAQRAAEHPPGGFRLVNYGALGGKGSMACFKPLDMFMNFGDGWRDAPDVWIAIYAGCFSKNISALAPPVMARLKTIYDVKSNLPGGNQNANKLN